MSNFLGHKPENQHVRALYECRNGKLVELFKAKLLEIQDSLVKASEPVTIHRLQGKALFIKEFLDAVEKSPEILERM
jgi:hypothetical protein